VTVCLRPARLKQSRVSLLQRIIAILSPVIPAFLPQGFGVVQLYPDILFNSRVIVYGLTDLYFHVMTDVDFFYNVNISCKNKYS